MTTETERTVWTLAGMAEVSSPDSLTSPGAEWLQRVALTVDDVRDYDDIDDGIHEQADGLVPVYTHHRWQVFVDLAAYTEDVDELAGAFDHSMEGRAGIALYLIAERLLTALVAGGE